MKEDDKFIGKRTVHKHAEKVFLGLFTTLEIKLTNLCLCWKVRWTSIWKCYIQPFVAMALEKHPNIYVRASRVYNALWIGFTEFPSLVWVSLKFYLQGDNYYNASHICPVWICNNADYTLYNFLLIYVLFLKAQTRYLTN